MGKFTLILILVAGISFGSTVVITNPNSLGVTNRVVGILSSQDTLAWQNTSNAYINPILPTNGTFIEWKVSNNVVMFLSTVDSNNISIAISNANWQIRTNAEYNAKLYATNVVDNFISDGRVLRAFAQVVLDEVNNLRTNPTTVLPARTMGQLRTAIINNILAQPDFNP